MQTLHSIIVDGQLSSVDGDTTASSRRLLLIGDQWRAIWQRVSSRLEAIDGCLVRWRGYQAHVDSLRQRLLQIEETLAGSSADDAVSVQAKRNMISRLQVRAPDCRVLIEFLPR
jgi:hypothetical protein